MKKRIDKVIKMCYNNYSKEREELDMAAIDTNNCPWAEKFLTDNKPAVDTGRKVRSGFCTYPIYKFDRKVLGA